GGAAGAQAMNRDREPGPVNEWMAPAGAHALILGGILFRLMVGGQRNDRAFKGFNMALPEYTVWILGLSTWLVHYWWVAALPLLGLVVANGVVLWRLGGWRRRPGWLWTWGVAGSLFSLWVAIELGFLLPMLKLAEGLEREP